MRVAPHHRMYPQPAAPWLIAYPAQDGFWPVQTVMVRCLKCNN